MYQPGSIAALGESAQDSPDVQFAAVASSSIWIVQFRASLDAYYTLNPKENHRMKYINMTAIVFLGVAAFAQNVRFDYNRSTNFNAYKRTSGLITSQYR
jgi:hypothetical protein